MIKIKQSDSEFTIQWYRYYVEKYGRDKVCLWQDSNKHSYILVNDGTNEDKSPRIQEQSTVTKSLSPSELESVPF